MLQINDYELIDESIKHDAFDAHNAIQLFIKLTLNFSSSTFYTYGYPTLLVSFSVIVSQMTQMFALLVSTNSPIN